jgi:hypothetical protein
MIALCKILRYAINLAGRNKHAPPVAALPSQNVLKALIAYSSNSTTTSLQVLLNALKRIANTFNIFIHISPLVFLIAE